MLADAGVGPNADGHDHQGGGDDAAIGQLHPFDLAIAEDRLGLSLGDDLDAALLELPLQHVAGRRVELALHQRRHQMQDGDVHVARVETGRGLEAEQAAADDDCLGARLGGDQHGVDVVEVAVGEDAGEVVARHRQDERHRAGGDDQLVVRHGLTVFGRHRLGGAVDLGDLVPLVEGDAVLDVPAVAVNDDLLVVLLARQHRRQHDAVVVDARLGVEDRDLVAAGRLFEQMLEHASRRHAVADDDEFLGHAVHSAASMRSFGPAASRSARLRLISSRRAGSGLAPPS